MPAATTPSGSNPSLPPAWLDRAVFYQIYPQSFFDTNGDGIGDIPGIIEKLGYLQNLGVNAIWLNPVFDSPFGDAGYDVRDYRKVAKRYGTNADLKRLFRVAHRRGMRVILDLVAGHTSIEHPWFKASRVAPQKKYSDYYVWTPSVWDEPREGKWINGFGPRDGNFLTNFFWFQPSLNYGYADPQNSWEQSPDAHGPKAVRAELQATMKYWLDAGCDGFRVDMASSLIKGPSNSPALKKLWGDFRNWLARDYPQAVLVSEWGHPTEAIGAGFHVDFLLHFGDPAYNALFGTWSEVRCDSREPHVFFERAGGGDITQFTEPYLSHLNQTRGRGFISLPTGNHDFPRLRRGRSASELRCIHAMLLTMPGVPFLYYGDEIGMDYLEDLPSSEGSFANRTGTRTPMQWNKGKNKGFSNAPSSKLYLPVDTRPEAPDVQSQEVDPNSHLQFVRRLLELRASFPALGNTGEIEFLYAQKNCYPLVYIRSSGEQKILVAINPRRKPSKCELDLKNVRAAHALAREGSSINKSCSRIAMDGISFGIFLLQ